MHPWTLQTVALITEATINHLKHHLHLAQKQMNTQADKRRSGRIFEVGDCVYVKLQPYRQNSLHAQFYHKLSPKYFGPFQVLQKVGAVGYKFVFPGETKIHFAFHVS